MSQGATEYRPWEYIHKTLTAFSCRNDGPRWSLATLWSGGGPEGGLPAVVLPRPLDRRWGDGPELEGIGTHKGALCFLNYRFVAMPLLVDQCQQLAWVDGLGLGWIVSGSAPWSPMDCMHLLRGRFARHVTGMLSYCTFRLFPCPVFYIIGHTTL